MWRSFLLFLQYSPILVLIVALLFKLLPNYTKRYLKHQKLLGVLLILSAILYAPNVLMALLMFDPFNAVVLASLGGPIAIFLAGLFFILNKYPRIILTLSIAGLIACIYLNSINIPPNLLFKFY